MMILNKSKLLLMAVFMTAFFEGLAAQVRQTTVRPFDFDVVVFPGESSPKARTDIYVWVRNTQLQFLKRDKFFTARYQINWEIYQDKGSALLTRDETSSVTEDKYAATIDPTVQHVHRFQVELSPNKYLFKVRLLDLNSGESLIQNVEKVVNPFDAKKLALSDILFLNTSDIDTISARAVIPPLRLPIQEKIYLYAEIVSPENIPEFDIRASLSQKGSAKELKFSRSVVRKVQRTLVLLELNNASMIRGESQLKLTVSAGQQSAEAAKTLRFISTGEEFAGLLPEDMIAPLVYVAEGDEWRKLRDATGEEREKLFKEFWDRRDPTPGTPENELFVEYYKRVGLANQQFSVSKTPGWKTDRGHVFIIYGPPDNVEKGDASSYGPGVYEIWYYDEPGKKFVFWDEFGFGEYRLVSGNL